ncbi:MULTISPECIES: hydantoinase B/oxoprolinase family protein [Bradyrhizobium]|uniref:Hydantoinase n=3 Tax=Bradyrhizobium TaxID=374 RepID=A0A410VIS5_9BRAD|nr:MULTISPECIES: hydantoinase B/oxoprolinase family protein [Bradyrhizobium]MCG2628024.1 hydantoinase B/oxoprolinase family protein [Bradyrhizobium zhengyangense]MCG2643143.1 hydantoinase B/oxoprolinase family protein [Bradyrhizobium zhengyangense]MCG2670543.1 hydantoinase B/oxoprolinase family protein [Bradyrhizobium zhengyangense]MDN4985722.1 hydantoinase B/oxoprolinase family protein [Bradyrhizobium sp. WYCCWR 13022]MDT4736563.1 hydantoinase B/oxoprolinase family protein [Bradyrhizobium sp.
MLDAIQLELIWRRLISLTEEAATTLLRTSFSSVVRESNDFACVLMDAEGRSLAQPANSIPSFIGTVPRTVRGFLKQFPHETLSEGDILITNDVWLGTGHLPDITVAKPIFLNGNIVAFAGSVTHAPDIGGRIRSADAREVYEEGFQIPMMKVVEAGRMNRTFESLLRQNVRTPDQTVGDLYAQFSALHLMEVRLISLLKEWELRSFSEVSQQIRGRTEAAMRRAISAIPDGVYHATAVSDGFENSIVLRMALKVHGDEIEVDYRGTDPQVQRSINVCAAYTTAYTAYGIKAVLTPDTPNNDGALEPLNIHAPLGSILNSKPPAAGGARALIGHFLPAMVLRALSQVVPERVISDVGSPLWCVNLAGVKEDGKTFANLFFLNGGYGASAASDGASVLSWPSNISSTPVEVLERTAPIRICHRRIRSRTAGSGRFTGGAGQEFLFENLNKGPTIISFMAERTKPEAVANGLAGGDPGAAGEIQINTVRVDPKIQHTIDFGARVLLRTPGAGGFGVPIRAQEALAEADGAKDFV